MRFIDDRVFFGDYDSMKYMCALHDHLADYFDTHLFTAEQRNWLKARDSVLEFGKNDRDYTTRIYAPSEIMLSYHLEVGRKSGLLDATFVTGEFGKMLES